MTKGRSFTSGPCCDPGSDHIYCLFLTRVINHHPLQSIDDIGDTMRGVGYIYLPCIIRILRWWCHLCDDKTHPFGFWAQKSKMDVFTLPEWFLLVFPLLLPYLSAMGHREYVFLPPDGGYKFHTVHLANPPLLFFRSVSSIKVSYTAKDSKHTRKRPPSLEAFCAWGRVRTADPSLFQSVWTISSSVLLISRVRRQALPLNYARGKP